VVAPDKPRADGEAQLVEEAGREKRGDQVRTALGEQARPAARVELPQQIAEVHVLLAAHEDLVVPEGRPCLVDARRGGARCEQDVAGRRSPQGRRQESGSADGDEREGFSEPGTFSDGLELWSDCDG
jgi:hypothetical protein